MGTVAFDLSADEIKFRDVSMNSVEDIYSFLDMLDITYKEHIDGNTYATCLILDFYNQVDLISNNKYIKSYSEVIIGEKPIKQKEINIGFIEPDEVSAYRLGVDKEEFLDGLHDNVKSIYKKTYNDWLNNINYTYKNKLIKNHLDDEKIKKHMNYERLLELDFLKKYTYSNNIYQGETPSEIQSLYDYRDKLVNDIKYFEKQKKKYRKKDNKRYQNYKEKASKLKTFKIQVDKDISILKKYYGIILNNNNRQGQLNEGNNISYDIENNEVLLAHNNQIDQLRFEQYNELMDEIYVGKIRKIAKECLTSRQFLIFELYYSTGMKQQEIADMIGDYKGNVSVDLKKSLNKIINKFIIT